MPHPLFQNRKLLIATKHQKEKVIAPLLEQNLGVSCFTNPQFDTDTLGTFSGEIERKLSPIETLRKKCLLAMEASNCDLAVASEGSFGMHPSLIFASADDEFLMLIDKKNNLEIMVRELSTDTNFDGKEIHSEKELLEFAEKSLFPSHALILRKSEKDNSDLLKGITKEYDLINGYQFLTEKYGKVFAETDMRAMFNPTRMKVIETAAKKLIDKINSECPSCQTPGFSVTEVKKGLPCELCGMPTNSTLSLIYSCQKCDFTEETFYPNEKKTEEPMYCNFCNP